MKIADREIGPGHPVFLQVETGVTHIGDLKRAFALIEAATVGGADACKFIVTDPEQIMSRKDVAFSYDVVEPISSHPERGAVHEKTVTRPIYELLRETQFSFEQWREIRDYCRQCGVIFYATADHLEAVDLLEALEVPAHKVSAWDLTYIPLLHHMAQTGKPVVVDVGTTTLQDYLDAFELIGPQFFPVLAPHPRGGRDWNFSRLQLHWGEYFQGFGFASPGRASWCDFLALGLGVSLIEKRLTLRRDDPEGHHHAISLEPDEFRDWVKQIRQAEAALREPAFGGSEMAWADRQKWGRDPVTGLRP